MFQLSLRCEKYAAARHNSVIGNQLLFANNRNRFRWVVLCLSQDGACTDFFENFRENSLKGYLSNDITVDPPLFSLFNTFNVGLRTQTGCDSVGSLKTDPYPRHCIMPTSTLGNIARTGTHKLLRLLILVFITVFNVEKGFTALWMALHNTV
jgi:hypothetical protein